MTRYQMPPPGWDVFGTHVDCDRRLLEFSVEVGEDLMPLWERPIESFTCPRCGMTSYNPHDIAEGFCGNCHDWTREEPNAEGELQGNDDGNG